MASRYSNTSTIKNSRKVESNGNVANVTRISSVIYPDFSNTEDHFLISNEGDRLDLLAVEYYGDETFWFVIARANGLGKGSMAVPPGRVIRIPYYSEYTGIASLLDRFNRMR